MLTIKTYNRSNEAKKKKIPKPSAVGEEKTLLVFFQASESAASRIKYIDLTEPSGLFRDLLLAFFPRTASYRNFDLLKTDNG